MNFDGFKKLTDKKKSINPVWFSLDADEIKDGKYIKKIECKLNAKLPLGYVEFILTYGGGTLPFLMFFHWMRKVIGIF
nr:SMI1/KNR4 family protein [Vibrio aphrogenes]